MKRGATIRLTTADKGYWSSIPPKKNGFYWWKTQAFGRLPVKIYNGYAYALLHGSPMRPKELGGEWWSEPIPEPPTE